MSVNEPAKGAPCPELEQNIVLFYFGELEKTERQRVERHVRDCPGCAGSLNELGRLLAKTLLSDEPPPAFWNGYSRELSRKLAEAGEREPWWRKRFFTLQPWTLSALAASVVVALALTFTVGKDDRLNEEMPPALDEPILEVLPMTENLDFFRNLDVLDTLELLESLSDPSKGAA